MKQQQKGIYGKAALTVLLTVCAILLFYDTFFGSRTLIALLKKLMDALAPILYGGLMAYLLAPVINFFDHLLFPDAMAKARARGKYCAAGPRAVSLLITWAIISLVVYLLLSILLPELYRSILQLWNNMELYYNTINSWITNLLESNPTVEHFVSDRFAGYYKDLLSVLTERVLPHTQSLVTAVSGGIFSALGFLMDLVVGIIVSIYFLATKERCAAHARRAIYALTAPRHTPWVFRGVHRVDEIFSGFVRGKILDSLIIGLICFIGCSLLNFPYTPLVSVIVGVTNVIPFFGPFLGAIPSIFLILLDSPLKAVYFTLFVFALQQVDGNIIGPKILGDKTGLSSLWVIVAILVGGSFFGVAGMFFGVPILACLTSFCTFVLQSRLRGKDLPTQGHAYQQDIPDPAAGVPAEPEKPVSDPPEKD